MRCTPMAVWTSSLQNLKEIQTAIISDVSMTHPSEVTQSAIVVYQCAIHVLLNFPQDKDRAQNALTLAKNLANAENFPILNKEVENCEHWLSLAEKLENVSMYHAINQMGWIKHAFILSFYYLK